jgi:transcription elongation factor GreA
MKKDYHLTKTGVAKLKDELEHLTSHRKTIAEKLKTARDYGDLSENAEYHDAREQQVQLESRVQEIEHILKNVQIIDEPTNKDVVELGNTILLNGDSGSQELTIVGSVEANPAENKISDESPIGQALLGKKIGEKVTISLPAGEKTYTIKQVN